MSDKISIEAISAELHAAIANLDVSGKVEQTGVVTRVGDGVAWIYGLTGCGFNELIEIAKEFSTDNSGQFVNGMLDAILLSLKKEGKIQKQGRGLLDTAIKPTSPEE